MQFASSHPEIASNNLRPINTGVHHQHPNHDPNLHTDEQ
ncbi:protein of unknown function [Thiomonas sp. Bio17B3]|nr:protein of unknown function [Thiomonas sp. Bio17B3]VDY05007.1 protein of unknown function [Thiomonas sp. Bio17B3]